MGNNENNENLYNNNHEINLINNEDNVNEYQKQNMEEEVKISIETNFDTLYIKELDFDELVYHVKNPVLILKEKLHLEIAP